MSIRACEHVALRTALYDIERVQGRTATVCEYDGQAVLRMYLNGKLVNTHKFPLCCWDMALEFGAGYLATGGKPANDSQ